MYVSRFMWLKMLISLSGYNDFIHALIYFIHVLVIISLLHDVKAISIFWSLLDTTISTELWLFASVLYFVVNTVLAQNCGYLLLSYCCYWKCKKMYIIVQNKWKNVKIGLRYPGLSGPKITKIKVFCDVFITRFWHRIATVIVLLLLKEFLGTLGQR